MKSHVGTYHTIVLVLNIGAPAKQAKLRGVHGLEAGGAAGRCQGASDLPCLEAHVKGASGGEGVYRRAM